MKFTGGSKLMRVYAWRNSLRLYLIAPVLLVIAAMSAISLVVLHIVDITDEGRPVSIYEMTRLLQGGPLAGSAGTLVTTRQIEAPKAGTSDLERFLALQLASRLGRPNADVRLTNSDQPPQRFAQVEEHVRMYSPDGAANPVVFGAFSIAMRDGSSWLVVSRHKSETAWRVTLWYALAFGLFLTLPLTFWFSSRLARPIKALAESARNMRGDKLIAPAEITGPIEIQLAAEALNKMQSRISRYVRERTALAGAIAHDLRTPLSRIHFRLSSAPDMLRNAIEQDVREMERLIQVTLEFIESEFRPGTREPIDLPMLLEGVAEDFSDSGKDAQVVSAEPATVMGDPISLRRLFANLVENAVKYGDSAQIAVTLDETSAKITVRDEGNGMADEELLHAFEPFYRGEPSRNQRTGGVGLGLSIVKSTVEAHGGKVYLTNGTDGGLVATVILPINDES